MSQKSYLKVDGIRGSSPDLGHIGDLEIKTFSYTYSGKSKTEQVKVTVQMELESSFGAFYDRMMNNQKLKEATLTVETRDNFNQLFQNYRAEMKGLKVIEVSHGAGNLSDPDHSRKQSWPIQRVSFLVDNIQFPAIPRTPEMNDQWKDS